VADWLSATSVVDAVIAITLLEAAGLIAYRWRTGRGLRAAVLLANLGAGLFLMFGLRAVLGGAVWPWLPVCLVGAGLAHLLDIRLRWTRS
jgi:hypothetical protein